MEIFFTSKFDRGVRRLTRKRWEYKSLIKHKILLLSESPSHPSLRLHKLSNKDEYALSVDQSIRIILTRKKDTVFLLDIGSHNDVY